MFAAPLFARAQTDPSPRGARGRAGSPTVPGGIAIGERTLTPSAVGILFRLQPIHRALDPRLVDIDADRAEPRQRREGAVDIVDTPAPPPSARGRLIFLYPPNPPRADRMISSITY